MTRAPLAAATFTAEEGSCDRPWTSSRCARLHSNVTRTLLASNRPPLGTDSGGLLMLFGQGARSTARAVQLRSCMLHVEIALDLKNMVSCSAASMRVSCIRSHYSVQKEKKRKKNPPPAIMTMRQKLSCHASLSRQGANRKAHANTRQVYHHRFGLRTESR